MAFEELLVRAGGVGLFQVLQMCTLFLSAALVPFHMILENFSAAVPDHRCWTPVLDNSSEVPANLTREALLAISIPPGPNLQPHRCRRFRHPQWQFLDPNATAANRSEAATEPCVDGWVYDHSTFTATVVTRWDLVCSSQSLKPLGQSIFMAGILAGAFVWGFLSYRLGRKPMLSWCYLQVAVAGAGAMLAPSFFTYCGLRFLSAFGLAGTILAQSTLMAEWTTTRRRAVTMAILGCTYSTGQMALAGLAYAVRDWQNLQLAVSIPFLATFLLSWWLPESARWLITTGRPEKALQELQKVARINGHKEAKETLTIEVLKSCMAGEVTETRGSVLDLFRVPMLAQRTCVMVMVNFSLMLSYYGLVLDLQSLGRNIFLLQTLFGAVDFLGRATTVLLLRFLGRRVTLVGSLALAGSCILGNVLVPQDLQTLRVALAVLGKGCFGISLTSLAVYTTELFPTPLRFTEILLSQLSDHWDYRHATLMHFDNVCWLSSYNVETLSREPSGLADAEAAPTCPEIQRVLRALESYLEDPWGKPRMTADGFLQSVGRLGAIAGPLIKMTGQVLPLMPPLTYGTLPIASSLVLLLSLPETKGIPLPDTIRDLEGRSPAAKGSQQEVVIMKSTWF